MKPSALYLNMNIESGDTLTSVGFTQSQERFHDPVMLEKLKVPGPDRYDIKSTLLGVNHDLHTCECTSKVYLAPSNPKLKDSRTQMKEEKIKRMREQMKVEFDEPGPGHYELPGSFGI